ncbi:TRAP transporter small permease [Lentibacillus salinarum]|uniref:TRAP transporter small permease n=1 Tax=Lentibacillus salinarum TaxID=446820 RepID=A0ABW3ZSF5_9BACI
MEKLFIWSEKVINFVGITMMCGIVASIVSQIVARNIFNSALIWPEEISQLLMISMVFLGACLVEKTDGQIKVDIIYAMLPNAKKIVTFIGKFITLIYTGLLLISEINLFPSVVSLTSSAAGIPLSIIHVVIFIGILLWIIVLLILLQHIIFKFGGSAGCVNNLV